jgi:hypothetical protein
MPSPAQGGKAFQLSKANPYESTSVRDKIKKWQVNGGGVLEEQDKDAEESASGSGSGSGSGTGKARSKASSHAKSKSEGHLALVTVEVATVTSSQDGDDAAAAEKPKTPSQVSKSSSKDKEKPAPPLATAVPAVPPDSPKPRIVERKPKANVLDTDLRDAIAPKKRIVSDGHWRRKHVDPNAKPPSPPKGSPKKEQQYGWVRAPLLNRPGQDIDDVVAGLKSAEEERVKTYTGKGKTKPIVSQIHSQLAMRPRDSVPIPEPAPKTPRVRRLSMRDGERVMVVGASKSEEDGPTTPRQRRPSVPKVKSEGDGPTTPRQRRPSVPKVKSEGDGPTTPRQRRPSRPEQKRAKSEEDETPKTARSNPTGRSRVLDSAYMSQDERPRTSEGPRTRTRLSKSRKTESEGVTDGIPTRKRSKSMGAPVQRVSQPRRSIPRSSEHYESADEERQQRRRRVRKPSFSSVSSHEDFSPPSPPRELNNYDDDAEKRRETFRAEFATFTPPKERRSHRKRGPKGRFSYSPEGVDRIPAPAPAEPVGEPVPPQRQTSTRIEAWLTETPDPFRETKKAESRRAFSFEKPPTSKKYADTVITESTITDSTISDVTVTESTITDTTASTRRKPVPTHDRKASRDGHSPMDRKTRAKSEPNDYLDPEIEVDYSSTTSVPTLKRSGAKHGSPSSTPTKPSSSSRRRAPTISEYTESTITESTITDSTLTMTESVVSSSIDPRDFSKPGEGGGQPYSVARRLFPSTGKRLSTIVSVETLATKDPNTSAQEQAVVVQDLPPTEDKLAPLPNLEEGSVVSTARSGRGSLKRKLTKHSDLMTVLSMPASRSKSVVSARSIRTHRSRLETATLEDLMAELASDEKKYMRELRTLADGVIPILLKCVLSKNSAADAAGLFRATPGQTEKEAVAEASKVIHDLSVAIQRLKSLHARIPKENHFSLLIWAQSAGTVYEKYIKTWRLGFQDVVVSLAQEGEGSTVSTNAPTKVSEGAWDQMPRNEDGYIVDASGERVDVAFLLKRPLVRLKYLSKTLKGINTKKPSEQAGVLSTKFEKLMELARKKVEDEKARVEDEAAAAIDATRARDPKSLAPLAGVRIDAARNVRARDFFDLHLPHSSGQTVDCRVEVLIRDDAPGRGSGGDFLICEVDESERWLLFPPVEFKRVSARAGEGMGEIVVMLRGVGSGGEEWDEVFSLTTEDEEVRFEWVQWLGLSPVPPPLGRKRAVTRPTSSHGSSLLSASARTESTAPMPLKSRTPSPREVEIPIGERAGVGAKRWSRDVGGSPRLGTGSETSSVLSSLDSERAILYEKKKYDDGSMISGSSFTESDVRTDITPPPREESRRVTPRNLNEAMQMAGGSSGSPTLKRARAKRYHSSPTTKKSDLPAPLDLKPAVASAQYESSRKPIKKERSIKKTANTGGFSVWIPNSDQNSDSDDSLSDEDSMVSSYLSGRPPLHHRTSSVPTLKLPSVPKQRSSRKEDEYMSGALVPEPLKTPSRYHQQAKEPASAPSKLERKETRTQSAPVSPVEDKPPPPPPHRTPSSNQVKFAPTPQFTPTAQVKRRSSSPLKHEYRPSSPSSESSYTEDEDSLSEYSQESLTSDSDSEDELHDDDVASTYVPSVVVPLNQHREPEREKPADLYSLPNGTIKPSESASQAPYRTVPQVVAVEAKPAKCVAAIFTWSDKGQWELLHSDDCSIVITPGLIAAYTMSANHASEALPEERPLVAQELTPLVPLRRGTALDITIRSPPTPASRLRPGSNIMLRSRSSEECEALYQAINRARINNPTYIALQNARPPTADGWAAAMERQNSQRGNGSAGGWLSGISRSKSYRASSRAHSTAGNTESSIGTISSVITAMKRFSGSGFIMDKARSRMSFSGGGSDSAGSGTHSPPHFVPSQPLLSGGAGISNAKIRLYVLASKKQWLDLGSAKLSILPKEDGAVIAAPIMLHTGQEKRIVVVKKKGERLLDVTLPENCFERWARTGIGVSVWVDAGEEGGRVADTGGVGLTRVVKYMIQVCLTMLEKRSVLTKCAVEERKGVCVHFLVAWEAEVLKMMRRGD